MRLLCRDDHDEPDECPPHAFESGWTNTAADGAQTGVMFCTLCGDVRSLVPPSVGAPVEESVSVERKR